jgi:hypothetical protein
MAVWVVAAVLCASAVAAVVATRHHVTDVEPTVREFTEFREALSQQVVGLHTDTQTTRTHLDERDGLRPVEPDARG